MPSASGKLPGWGQVGLRPLQDYEQDDKEEDEHDGPKQHYLDEGAAYHGHATDQPRRGSAPSGSGRTRRRAGADSSASPTTFAPGRVKLQIQDGEYAVATV